MGMPEAITRRLTFELNLIVESAANIEAGAPSHMTRTNGNAKMADSPSQCVSEPMQNATIAER